MMEATTQLVSIVGQLVGDEYRQIRRIGGQVAELSDELDTMNAILRMLSDAEEGAVDHFIRVWMKQVRELAYDAEDCVHLYILRIRCRPRDRFLVWSRRMFATLFPRRRLAREIQALHARAVVISERHARYGVSREALLRCTPTSLAAPMPVLGRPAADDADHLVGIAEQAGKLSNMVKAVEQNEHDKKLNVFAIVGFGGLGKTTLAIEVCRMLEAEFPHQAQVSVSQAFRGTKDLQGLIKRVLQQIVKPKADNPEGINIEDPLDGIHEMDVDTLTAKLEELLKGKRYLIVVDDVWTVGTWEAIRSKLPENENGRVIVTTRIETVAEACSDGSVDRDHIHQMKPLDLEESKKLFLSRAFGSEDAPLHDDLAVEMNKILKKCGGLPMAIISIAKLLARSESKDVWEKVCKSIGSQLENHPTLEGMRQIVSLSYNHLHYYLKGCMMYLSIFPEDYVIVKKRLLKRWIAEGLVAEVRGLTLMETAEAYYDELVSRNMIGRAGDIVSWWDGTVQTCRVHDMVLEVMVSKSLEANFVSLVGGPYEEMSYASIRRLSIHGGEEVAYVDSPSNKTEASHGKKNAMERMNMEHVRSLSMFGPGDQKKLLDRLREFTLLRVLDLEDCKGIKNEHLIHVCKMYLLRFLSLKGTVISEIPSEVGGLENLETLDVRETQLEDLPKTVTKLEKLEHLQINKKDDYLSFKCWKARKGLGRMKALQTLNVVVFDSDADAAEELGELQQLRELRMSVATDPGHLDVRQKLAKALSKIYSLRWLNITDRLNDGEHLDFINGINPPPRLLRHLRLGSGISKLPDWIGSLNYLTQLFLSWTYLVGDQLFGPVCKLPNLWGIHLEAYYYVDTELVAKTAHKFPALKKLYLNMDIEGLEVLRFEENTMSKLEKLHVRFLAKETKILERMDHLTSLKEVRLEGNEGNPALHRALEQLKTINEKRHKSDQIKVVVKHDTVQWPNM